MTEGALDFQQKLYGNEKPAWQFVDIYSDVF